MHHLIRSSISFSRALQPIFIVRWLGRHVRCSPGVKLAREFRVPSHQRDFSLIRTQVRQAHSFHLDFLIRSKLCQSLVGLRDIQQLALVLGAGHLLGLSTCLFCALSPVLGIVKCGQCCSPAGCLRWMINECCARAFHLSRVLVR